MANVHAALDDEFLTRLRQFVRRRTPTAQDAEDVVQDSILALLRKGAAVPEASVRAWLFTVARRSATDRWRGRSKTAPLDGEPSARTPEAPDRDAVAYLAGCMEPMLHALPKTDQEVLRRIDIAEDSQADVARELQISASTLKSRVQRARRRLRTRLEGCCAVERDGRGTPIAYERRPEAACPCPAPSDSGTEGGQDRQGCARDPDLVPFPSESG